MSGRRATRRPRTAPARRRRVVLLVTGALVVVLAAAVAWVAVRGLLAKNQLEAAIAASDEVSSALAQGDVGKVGSALDLIADHSGSAMALMSDPVWHAAEFVPAAGPNLAAMRIAAEQSHALAAEVAAPLMSLASTLTAGDGSLLDVRALAAGRPALQKARAAVAGAVADLHAIDLDALLPPLREGVSKLLDVARTAEPAVGALGDAALVTPTMLGADGPRTILVMVQNNAELRTGGGITGTFIELRADAGTLTIMSQVDSSDFGARSAPIIDLPSSTTELYGDVTGRFVQDASITPDFDLTARLASAWWQERAGAAPDAVVSVDPLVVRAVLQAVGGVDTPDGPLTSDNVVQRLLVDPYMQLTAEQQAAVFRNAATAVFTRMTEEGIDPVPLVQALATPIAEGRVSVWSRFSDEERVLAQTPLGGPAARHRDAGPSAYAVYFNDATGGKMTPYLDVAISSGIASCRGDDQRTVSVSVTLTNTAPADAATRFPLSVTGAGIWGVGPGRISTNVAVAAPPGAFLGGVRVDGALVAAPSADDAGFPTAATRIEIPPGASATVEFRFLSAASGSPDILTTPLIDAPILSTHEVRCG